MSSSLARRFILLLFCAAMTLPLRSQELPPLAQAASKKTSASEKKSPPVAESKKTVELKKLDLASLPAEAVIVLCERAGDVLDLLPKAVILRPDKYKALLDQIAKLKKELDALRSENAAPPTRCGLRGKVESGAVHLEAEFAGTAERADALVALACSQAGVSSAETDGRMARIQRSETGAFLVRIEKAGEYHVKLDLLLPLAVREGGRRGFELTLPRAVITQLELELPNNCTEVRAGGQSLKDLPQPGLELKNRRLSGNLGLGPVDRLDLTWKEARNSAEEPVRTAEGRIRARLDRAGLTTEADLWLSVEGAPAKVWRLLVPKNAEVKVVPSEKETRIDHRLESAEQKFASLRTIHLKEARSEPLHVQVKLPPQPLRGPSATLPIGPFFVLDAARQTGTVWVRNQVRNLHLDYRGHGDMQLRRQEADETKGEAPATVATLVYSNVPLVENPEGPTGPNSRSWLDLEAVILPAQVRMRLTHTLTLRSSGPRDGSPPPRQWDILTSIAPATKWNDLEQLKILVPPNWGLVDESTSVVAERAGSGSDGKGNSHWLTIPAFLLRAAPTQAQRLHGRYQASFKAGERALLRLPRPQGTVESCDIKLEAPADAEVVVHNTEQFDLELSRQPRPNEQTWRCRNVPAGGLAIEISWRPYRPELRVLSTADLTLHDSSGEVRQELRLQLPAAPPAFVNLRVLASIADNLQIKDDQGQEIHPTRTALRSSKSKTGSFDADFGFRIAVPPKAGGSEWRLTMQYPFSVSPFRLSEEAETGSENRKPKTESRKPFLVPLVTVEQATGGEAKARIWSEAGLLPRSASASWELRNIEEVKGRELPVLVLHATRLDAPLRLIGREQAIGSSVLIERSQMRVQLLEGGSLNWRASFRLRQLAGGDVDVELPGPVATLNARFLFNGNRVVPDIRNASGEHSEGGDVARLHLSPDLVRQPALLEVLFQSPPGRTAGSPLRSILQPPRILRATAAPTCWQVSVPAHRVLLAPESAAGVERTWTRRGWLLAATLSPLSSSVFAPIPGGESSGGEWEPIAVICWQDQAAPLVLTHAPQQGWLMVCSLGLLIVGLGLYWLARPHAGEPGRASAWFWPLLAAITLAVAVATLFWPTTMCAVAYGCQPGAVVLLAVLGLQWLMHRRYRRQIVFLPSFSRGSAGSSLIRKAPSSRPQSGEPSTVDAPPPVG